MIFNKTKKKKTSNFLQFSHLSKLNLRKAHMSYVEQFLLHTTMSLPYFIQIEMGYDQLIHITENFINHLMRIICEKNQELIFDKTIVHSYDFYQYFPL